MSRTWPRSLLEMAPASRKPSSRRWAGTALVADGAVLYVTSTGEALTTIMSREGHRPAELARRPHDLGERQRSTHNRTLDHWPACEAIPSTNRSKMDGMGFRM